RRPRCDVKNDPSASAESSGTVIIVRPPHIEFFYGSGITDANAVTAITIVWQKPMNSLDISSESTAARAAA
ncbi:MAG TPA: hypothetical protein VFO74_07720, partial [Pseudolabrys sp.]|nr:hypothetical protein [Pseudolabrys sp.]